MFSNSYYCKYLTCFGSLDEVLLSVKSVIEFLYMMTRTLPASHQVGRVPTGCSVLMDFLLPKFLLMLLLKIRKKLMLFLLKVR